MIRRRTRILQSVLKPFIHERGGNLASWAELHALLEKNHLGIQHPRRGNGRIDGEIRMNVEDDLLDWSNEAQNDRRDPV